MTRDETIDAMIRGWAQREPEPKIRSRLFKARDLVNNVRAVAPRDDGSTIYLIEGSSGNSYVVEMKPDEETSCTCPDAQRTDIRLCKHQIAVKLNLAARLPSPSDPATFEVEIRRWLRETPTNQYWLQIHGEWAIRLLLEEVDRLRTIQRQI